MQVVLIDGERHIPIATDAEQLNILNSALRYYSTNDMGSPNRSPEERRRRMGEARAMSSTLESVPDFPTFYLSDEERG